MPLVPILLVSALIVAPVFAQGVSEISIRVFPQAKVRPLEPVQLQVKAYSQIGDGKKGRLNKGGATMKILSSGGGWVSKPYKFQGEDDEPFYQQGTGRFATIFGSLTKDYVLQDAFLYTAPAREGKFEVEADMEGKKATATIEVSNGAPSLRKPETASFGSEERKPDPYRWLAEHWAPVLAQETWFQPKSDMAARFDFDNDWHGDNNWDNMEIGSSQAYVYYQPMETATHWFLIYNVFHPRDYSDKCIAGSCHENDNEGLILTVRKDGSEFGKLEVVQTLAHNNVYSYSNDSRIRSNVHRVEGPIEFIGEHHPVVFIESGGHGIYGTRSSHGRFDVGAGKFTVGTGITYVYKGVAERPQHPDDRNVGYELLPISEHWWTKGTDTRNWAERTFDEFFAYQPFGGRPGIPEKFGKISGAFLGRKEASNKARPFWGWFDNATRKKKVVNTGQWALDPAYSINQGLRFPDGEQPSMDYTYNPYLGVD